MDRQREMFLVKMCDDFEEHLAQFHLNRGIQYHEWLPSSAAEMQTPPDDLVEAILARFSSLGYA